MDDLYNLYLFTKSDIKTVVLPTTVFAVSNVLSGYCLSSGRSNATSPTITLTGHGTLNLIRLALAVLGTWTGLLVENIANQRLPHSVLADSVNKPWRPIVASRVSQDEARRLLILAIGVFFALSVLLRAQEPFFTLMVLIYIYNDLRGADEHLILRNALNAGGLMSFGVGATMIAAGGPTRLLDLVESSQIPRTEISSVGWTWTWVVGIVVTSTVSTQDLEDVDGDRKQSRKTLPLVWGLGSTRIYLAVSVICWNIICTLFWQLSFMAAILPTSICGILSINLLGGRSRRSDVRSWRLWCLWMIGLSLLPALKSVGEEICLERKNGRIDGIELNDCFSSPVAIYNRGSM